MKSDELILIHIKCFKALEDPWGTLRKKCCNRTKTKAGSCLIFFAKQTDVCILGQKNNFVDIIYHIHFMGQISMKYYFKQEHSVDRYIST